MRDRNEENVSPAPLESQHDDHDTARVDELRRAHPRWSIWWNEGRWWAARKEPLTRNQLSAGCVMLVRALTEDTFLERIDEQEQLAGETGEDG